MNTPRMACGLWFTTSFLLLVGVGPAPGEALQVRTNYQALVLYYNPHVLKDGALVRVKEAYGYRNVDDLCASYITFLRRASGGQINFSVTKKFELDEYPPDLDPAVTFTPENFDRYRSQGYDIFNNGKADYETIIKDARFEIVPRVERGEVDCVWVFAPDCTGFWETAMAGRGAYWINGGEYPDVGCSKRFVIYGFGMASHQGVGFMLENTAHMVENIMGNRIASGWPTPHRVLGWTTLNLNNPSRAARYWSLNDWDYLTVSDAVHWNAKLVALGQSQAGLSHFPPTACVNYGWSAPRYNFDVHWEANDFHIYGGAWSLENGCYSVGAGSGGRAILQGSHDLKDDLGEYRVPVIITDCDVETGVTLGTNAGTAHAGLLLRCSRYGAGENALRGYYLGINPGQNRIELARLDNSYTALTNRPVALEYGRSYRMIVSLRERRLEVALTNVASPVLVWTNLSELDGAVGLASYGGDASFSHLYVTPVIRNFAESWRRYPDLGTNSRILSPLEWRGDGQPYEDNDYWYAWWYEHLPKNPGIHAVNDPGTGELLGYALNSWWPYLFDINRFDTPFLPQTNILCAGADTAAPAPPGEVRGATVDARTVRIQWNEPADNIGVTRYEIYRDGTLMRETPLKFFLDSSVEPGSSHTYRVKARDGSGNISGPSESVTLKTPTSETALRNANFEDGFELPLAWNQEASEPGAVFTWEPVGVGHGATRCVCLEANEPNDARWTQGVSGLVPRGRYRLSGWIKGEGIVLEPGGTVGPNLCACQTSDYTLTTLAGTFDWTFVQGDVFADGDGKLTVGCRLGFWGSSASGKAWFDDLSLEYVPPTIQPVIAWGADFSNLANLPDGLSNTVAVACGGSHSMALKADGTVVVWGSNGSRQRAIPQGLGNVISIGAGSDHCLAVRENGAVAAWGENMYGQCDVPADVTNALAVAGGERFSMALLADGTVRAWGSNQGLAITVPVGLANVVSISAGYELGMALKADGTVAAWGTFRGTDDNPYPVFVPAGLSNIVGIACGYSFCLALKSDGTVCAWGDSPSGETNVPPNLNGVIAVSAGASHALALRQDGSVVAWGGNEWNQLEPPPQVANVFAVAAGPFRNVAVIGNEPPSFTLRPVAVSYAQNTFTATFEAKRGRAYFLLAKTALAAPSWRVAEGLAARDHTTTLAEATPQLVQCFYCIRAPALGPSKD